MGENLGADYKLTGSDGTTITGGGEGGNIFWCTADGKQLRRVATGFWNPFGQCFDAFGRLFIVDNDPDSRGPCRLLHIIEGGDYGYRYRNGRKGLHPFTAWNGELPGTLPMVAGTSEAPCAVVAYESTGLPADYRGDLLVTSWGDHVIERFRLQPKGASFTSQAHIVVRGGEDFRPVAMAIAPDGSVEIKMGTQDLGTGARTIITIVAAEALGIPMEYVTLLYGNNKYPQSGGSGGSTTSGGVTASTRRGAVNARDALFAKIAPSLKAQPEELEAHAGRVQVKGDPSRSLSWKEACAKIGAVPLTVRGQNPNKDEPPDLTNSGVGGVQMADVSVDTETGIVSVNKMVAVQDCGLVVDVKTAESQVYGALIMGISYALYEEKILDPVTGRVLNPNLEFYRLAGLSDIGELKVHMMTGKGYDERGVIGLAEPPVVSPGAAISNAVANAVGVRVPFLPLTPDRILAALEGAGGSHA